jgi:hypothetical protein
LVLNNVPRICESVDELVDALVLWHDDRRW